MAESITEGTLKQWNKAVGDFVEQDEEIATIETDKVSLLGRVIALAHTFSD
jgi:2-oxoglutarate dehydrogenase E2 component (dihydrolipoamide succinyltransferase)